MAKKRALKKQSLAKNIALLALSLVVLAGASFLFSAVSDRPEFSLDPVGERFKNMVADENKPPAEPSEPQKLSAGGFEYSYWDILLLDNGDKSASSESYSIQIAAFRSHESAVKFASELQEKSRVRCTVTNTGTWSVVRWGTFHNRETAERYCSKLSEKLKRECIVVKM
ncbi:MAG: SPOR domain-containing protein [Desulfomonilia bacterium]|jgi:hypothetical protein